ncbi:helix-turn-helix domain-containing protein [Butyricicoccus porcorum]|uniref:helix-turn-helix domain-containing protein n=1 Tax=Butyricicoccus porcorum TaxID=1945634 RepID=UPI003F4AE19C
MYKVDEECKAMIDRLKGICEIKGIKPNALAKKAGIASSTLSYILNGKTQPQVYTLLQLCNALEITIEELFRETKSNTFEVTQGVVITKRSDSHVSEALIEVLPKVELSYDELELLAHYRYFSKKKKGLLRMYVDMLLQYRKFENTSLD